MSRRHLELVLTLVVCSWLVGLRWSAADDYAATFVDITDRKQKERQMESIATSDPLTGVLNRRGFERDAAKRLTESEDDATGALLFIDLNGFKGINDEFGHEVGDQLLKIAADQVLIAENHVRKIIVEEFPPNRHERMRGRFLPGEREDGKPFSF